MIDRRTFCWFTAGIITPSSMLRGNEPAAPLRVAVIGHTGRGGYGHGLDTVWKHVEATKIVAVADADPSGLKKELKKLALDGSAGHDDYRLMLDSVRPDIVAVCPRHVDQHHEMMLAAIQAGAKGIYVEKPFVALPSQADEIVQAADQSGTKIAVAHRNRYHPTLHAIDRLLQDKRIGRLIEIRGRGKGDHRGGAEDLWVLGSHVLNLMAYFGGRPSTCSATMLEDGRRVARADVHEGAEGLGLLAGNALHARFHMERGVVGYFDSVANDGANNFGFGLQLIGSQGIIHIQCDAFPLAYLIPGNPFRPTKQPRPWLPITSAGLDEQETIQGLKQRLSSHVIPVEDLVAAVHENRAPICNAREAALTVEMICAVFESHRRFGQEVTLPLKHRGNALATMAMDDPKRFAK